MCINLFSECLVRLLHNNEACMLHVEMYVLYLLLLFVNFIFKITVFYECCKICFAYKLDGHNHILKNG